LTFVLPTPVETADDAFHDPVVGCGGGTDAYAKVDLTDGLDVEIDSRKRRLLLIMEAGDVRDASIVDNTQRTTVMSALTFHC
jgi:hypothetical protein